MNNLSPITGNFPFYKYAAKHNIWEFIPMDQGGRLVHLQLIGSESDERIVAEVRCKSFYKPWRNPIQWDALESTEIEKSVWLNRWYILPSFARRYFVTGNRRYLDDLLEFFRNWKRGNPVPSDLPGYFASGKYNWRDMQVAWRTQNLIWCYFLGEKGFTASEKHELYDMIAIHARVLHTYFGKQTLHRNNHQSHGAAAMLLAAVLFPSIPSANVLRRRAIAILNHHLKSAFYDDGNSVELSPGYYPFITSIFRDVFLVCKANGIRPPRHIERRLRQFHNYLNVVAQPDGTMPPINDSSECDAKLSRKLLANILKIKAGRPKSHHFAKSGQAVMRDNKTYLFIDSGPQMLWHWHGGKLGFHLWFGNRALLLDSGVCNYDDPRRVSWYCTPQAHNTLLVDGAGDYQRSNIDLAKEPLASCRVARWESNERYDLAVMVHDGFASRDKPVSWVRFILLIKGMCIVIVDQLRSDSIHEYRWPFHLPPGKLNVSRPRKGVVTRSARENILILPADPACFDGCEIGDGWISKGSESIPAPLVQYRAKRKSVFAAFCLVPFAGRRAPKVSIGHTSIEGKIRLNIVVGQRAAVITTHRSQDAVTAAFSVDFL